MSDFRIVENNELFFVTDTCGHSLFTTSDEKEAKAQIRKFDGVVKTREAANKDAERNNPRR